MYKVLVASAVGYLTDRLAAVLRADHDVYTCSCGSTALDCLHSIRPDILVIDLSLPHTDGLTVLRQAAFRPPVVIALAAYISPSIARAAGSWGVGCIVMLPNSIETVLSCLDGLIAEKLHNKTPSPDQ